MQPDIDEKLCLFVSKLRKRLISAAARAGRKEVTEEQYVGCAGGADWLLPICNSGHPLALSLSLTGSTCTSCIAMKARKKRCAITSEFLALFLFSFFFFV